MSTDMDREPPLSADEFAAIYAKVPRLNVEVVIQDGQGILLSRRSAPS